MSALTNTAKNAVQNGTPAQQTATSITTIRTSIDKMLPQIAKVLPKHLSPERVSRIAMTTI